MTISWTVAPLAHGLVSHTIAVIVLMRMRTKMVHEERSTGLGRLKHTYILYYEPTITITEIKYDESKSKSKNDTNWKQ